MSKTSKFKDQFLIWIPLVLGIILGTGILIGYQINPKYQFDTQLVDSNISNSSSISSFGRIEEIIRLIEHIYVDSIDSQELTQSAINQVLSELDPFSSYISPEDLNDYNNELEGIFNGIGINYILWNDSMRILKVLEDSPAKEFGLSRRDIILSINNDSITGPDISTEKIRTLISSMDSEPLNVSYFDHSENRLKSGVIEPQNITLESSRFSYLIEDNTIYNYLERFSSNTFKQFIQGIEEIVEEGKSYNLILDLRDNPGGYLPETIKILSQFFTDKQKILTYTEGANRKRKDYKSTGQQFFNIDKIAVLINENSASGSEIIAGALQDWDRAILLGKASFGKGLVQEIHELKNGGAIRLTVARYMTPSGRSIQKSYRLQDQIKISKDSIYKSMVLDRDLIGGGGIIPDIMVDDLNLYADCQGLNYSSIHAFLLNAFPVKSPYDSFESCLANFEIGIEEIEQFNEYVSDNDENLLVKEDCHDAFIYFVKGELIESWYSEDELAIMRNLDDPVVLEALNALNATDLQALLLNK